MAALVPRPCMFGLDMPGFAAVAVTGRSHATPITMAVETENSPGVSALPIDFCTLGMFIIGR